MEAYSSPFAPIGRRNVSNVPAQALTLLNDPFVHAMARHWADRLLQATERDTDSLIDAAYRDAFARAPTAEEIEACSAFLHQAAADHGTGWTIDLGTSQHKAIAPKYHQRRRSQTRAPR